MVADTMGTREAAEKWGYPQTTIATWCREGKIVGAEQYRKRGPWQIPKDAKCPKSTKKQKG